MRSSCASRRTGPTLGWQTERPLVRALPRPACNQTTRRPNGRASPWALRASEGGRSCLRSLWVYIRGQWGDAVIGHILKEPWACHVESVTASSASSSIMWRAASRTDLMIARLRRGRWWSSLPFAPEIVLPANRILHRSHQADTDRLVRLQGELQPDVPGRSHTTGWLGVTLGVMD